MYNSKMIIKKLFYILVFISSSFTLLMSLCFTPIFTSVGFHWVGYTWQSMHCFILPHVIVSFVIMLTLILSNFLKAHKIKLNLFLLIAYGCLPISFWYALHQWPGGDDGGGLAWLIFMGPAVIITIIMAAIYEIISKKPMDHSDSIFSFILVVLLFIESILLTLLILHV